MAAEVMTNPNMAQRLLQMQMEKFIAGRLHKDNPIEKRRLTLRKQKIEDLLVLRGKT